MAFKETKRKGFNFFRSYYDVYNELETDEFGAVFREFSRRESIYGFGDLQVKKLLDQIKLLDS